MAEMTRTELDILKSLVGLALENKGSSIKDLTNEHREALYVVFAKLVNAMEESADVATSPRPARDWSAGSRLASG